MKITDPQVIEDGEKDLIQSVQEDLDLDAVRQILKDRMAVSSLASKGGQIVVHNNKIAFRLDFDIQLSGSLLFDRQGNYIDESLSDTPLASEMASEMALESEMDLEEFEDDNIIGEPLSDEIPLVDTGMDDTDLYQTDLEDEISDLPEYSLEDEPEDEIVLTDIDDQPLLDLEDDDPDIMAGPDSFDAKDLTDEDLDGEILLQEEMLDDDINDILKESREFWEQKKDS